MRVRVFAGVLGLLLVACAQALASKRLRQKTPEKSTDTFGGDIIQALQSLTRRSHAPSAVSESPTEANAQNPTALANTQTTTALAETQTTTALADTQTTTALADMQKTTALTTTTALVDNRTTTEVVSTTPFALAGNDRTNANTTTGYSAPAASMRRAKIGIGKKMNRPSLTGSTNRSGGKLSMPELSSMVIESEASARAALAKQQKLKSYLMTHTDQLPLVVRGNQSTVYEVVDELFFLESSSVVMQPVVQAYAAATALHAQANIMQAKMQDRLQNMRRLRYKLLEGEKVVKDWRDYAKHIEETIAEDRLVLGSKERLNKTPSGKILLQVAAEEVPMLRDALDTAQKGIVAASHNVALARKFVVAQEANVEELADQLKTLTQQVIEADMASCRAASSFAATQMPTAQRWARQAAEHSKQAVQNLQVMVLKCANGACTLLPTPQDEEDAKVSIVTDDESTTPGMRFAHDDVDTTTESVVGMTTEVPSPDTTATESADNNNGDTDKPEESTKSPEQQLAQFHTWLVRPDGLMPVLRATQRVLHTLEMALHHARQELAQAKEGQRQAIASPETSRFQAIASPCSDSDSDCHIAALARDIVAKEAALQDLLAKVALQRAAYLAVTQVAKTRHLERQSVHMQLSALQYKNAVDQHCRTLINLVGSNSTDTTQPPEHETTDADTAADENNDEMF